MNRVANTVMLCDYEYAALRRDAELGSKLREMVNAGKIDVRNIMALFPNLVHRDRDEPQSQGIK